MSLEHFFEKSEKPLEWGLYNELVDRQTWVRCKVTLAAYAYEFENRSIISDQLFDDLCKEVDLSINTRRPDLDTWFRENFQPDTGMWIHKHPELDRIKSIYNLTFK